MEGWFKIHRIIFENGLWSNPSDLRLFLWLLGHAVHKEEGVRIGNIKIKRGQYLRSYRKLQEDLQYVENNQVKTPSLSALKRSIDRLIDSERVKMLGTELGTLFTINNYEKYQLIGGKNELFDAVSYGEKPDLRTGLGTSSEHQRNNNKNDKNDKVINVLFEKFWNLYDKKVSKEKSFRIWNKLTIKEKEKIFEALPEYIRSTPDKQYRKNPDTYLRNKCWNDEIYVNRSNLMSQEIVPESNQYL